MSLLAVAVSGRGVVDPDEPVLPADDEALLRGRAAFETVRVYGGRPFRLAEHLERLAGSAELIGLPDANRLEAAQRVFLGGHTYEIDATLAAELTAAGYGSNIT